MSSAFLCFMKLPLELRIESKVENIKMIIRSTISVNFDQISLDGVLKQRRTEWKTLLIYPSHRNLVLGATFMSIRELVFRFEPHKSNIKLQMNSKHKNESSKPFTQKGFSCTVPLLYAEWKTVKKELHLFVNFDIKAILLIDCSKNLIKFMWFYCCLKVHCI